MKNKVPLWSDDPQELKVLQQGLLKEIEKEFGLPERSPFAWVIKDDGGMVVAGVAGTVHWNWVYVAQLWVGQELQKKGLGRQLMQHLESWAVEKNYSGIYIDTFSASVKAFYEKLGFQLMGVIPNFPPQHERYFLFRPLGK